MATKNGKFLKEIKSWTKPAKGLVLTPGKAIYSLAKTAFRHPYATIAATVAHGAKTAKWKKRKSWFNTPLAGQNLKKWYL